MRYSSCHRLPDWRLTMTDYLQQLTAWQLLIVNLKIKSKNYWKKIKQRRLHISHFFEIYNWESGPVVLLVSIKRKNVYSISLCLLCICSFDLSLKLKINIKKKLKKRYLENILREWAPLSSNMSPWHYPKLEILYSVCL